MDRATRVRERIRDDELLLSFNEAVEYLRTSRTTLYRLMYSGRLVGRKVGRKWVFYKGDLKGLLDHAGLRPTADGSSAGQADNLEFGR
ncbi:MAG: helix-turn-helix domain-containing protein [Chloroflexi bacterium]|nr:helix-turn-helix domain-containing protein [Chloroflexota bacterium]